MMGVVDVLLLYLDDCPNWRLAEARLREALAGIGDTTSEVIFQLVRTPEEAEQAGFRGSPTILVNGTDPFAGPGDPVGLSCRLYRSETGAEHAPSVEQLRSVLADAR